jgi:hypothetical protein
MIVVDIWQEDDWNTRHLLVYLPGLSAVAVAAAGVLSEQAFVFVM